MVSGKCAHCGRRSAVETCRWCYMELRKWRVALAVLLFGWLG